MRRRKGLRIPLFNDTDGGNQTPLSIGAILAISAVELLKAFINVQLLTTDQLAWKVGIHLTFVVSGVMFALTDRIAESKGRH